MNPLQYSLKVGSLVATVPLLRLGYHVTSVGSPCIECISQIGRVYKCPVGTLLYFHVQQPNSFTCPQVRVLRTALHKHWQITFCVALRTETLSSQLSYGSAKLHWLYPFVVEQPLISS